MNSLKSCPMYLAGGSARAETISVVHDQSLASDNEMKVAVIDPILKSLSKAPTSSCRKNRGSIKAG